MQVLSMMQQCYRPVTAAAYQLVRSTKPGGSTQLAAELPVWKVGANSCNWSVYYIITTTIHANPPLKAWCNSQQGLQGHPAAKWATVAASDTLRSLFVCCTTARDTPHSKGIQWPTKHMICNVKLRPIVLTPSCCNTKYTQQSRGNFPLVGHGAIS